MHGLLHLLGFAKAFLPAGIPQLAQPIARPTGVLWLLAALLLLATALSFLLKQAWWWMPALAALLLSQTLILLYWQEARFGTLANGLLLIAVLLGYGSWRFAAITRQELQAFTQAPASGSQAPLVTEQLLAKQPPLVQQWMRRAQVLGRPLIQRVYLTQQGRLRTSPAGKWMPFTAQQWFTTAPPAFLWIADVQAAPGLHLAGRDKYLDGRGAMTISLLSLFPVAEAQGPETDQGTLVRYLAETIWFPTAALRGHIQWQQLDADRAQATMRYGGVSASAVFTFSPEGDVLRLEAKRYYSRQNSKPTREDWLITIDPASYRSFAGMRIPTRSTVTWRLQEGDFTWLRLTVTGIHYNQAADQEI